MLSQITKRTIHEEARQPSFDTVSHVLDRWWVYLDHILRLDQHRALKKFLIELSPKEQPFPRRFAVPISPIPISGQSTRC